MVKEVRLKENYEGVFYGGLRVNSADTEYLLFQLFSELLPEFGKLGVNEIGTVGL